MLQKPALSACVHVPVASLQLSVVHVRPSVHVVVVAHTLEPLHTPQPSAEPSLHRAPVLGLQVVWLAVGSHLWHGFAGSIVPVA